MRKTTITCAILATTLGFSSLASARDWNDRGPHQGPRHEQRHDARPDHRHGPRPDLRPGQRPVVRHAPPPVVRPAPRVYNAPRHHPRFVRGGYVPQQYRQPIYYVNDWRGRPGMYAPPPGHRWVQTDTGEILLMAVATGLIVNLLMNQ